MIYCIWGMSSTLYKWNLSTYTYRFQSAESNLFFPTFATSLNDRVRNNAQIKDQTLRPNSLRRGGHNILTTIARPNFSHPLLEIDTTRVILCHTKSNSIMLLAPAFTLTPSLRTSRQKTLPDPPVAINTVSVWVLIGFPTCHTSNHRSSTSHEFAKGTSLLSGSYD